MNYSIRKEKPSDYQAVFSVIEKAFRDTEHTNHKEQFLVESLRNSFAFVEELSLVAMSDHQIIGHILLTKIVIANEGARYDSLALAPVSVLPEYQGKGVGSKLINQAHQKAKSLGFKSIVLLGDPNYYSRFGYEPAHTFGISLPFDVPLEYCMAIELEDGALDDVNGEVIYPEEFSKF